MPANRNALIRYKTIDKCLQNHYRKWTLNDLIDACSDALYEYEGIDKSVGRRTIQADIQIMRSDKLGYNAPIIVVDKKYYKYEDKEYSITNIPISEKDLSTMMESVDFLKQFKGFSHFRELDTMVRKLEDHVYSKKMNQRPVIDFEKNENLKGLNFLDELYQTIIKKEAINITYQSFKARSANSFDFHPYILKEYRNRWFVLGTINKNDSLMNLALDRILKLSKSKMIFIDNPNFNADSHFRHAIGVSVSPTDPPQKVILFIPHKHAPYVLTKPLHHSQKTLEKDHFGVTISLMVQHNFELEKEILSLGDGIKVISPPKLKKNIKERLIEAVDSYDTDIDLKSLTITKNKLIYKGHSVLNKVYTNREVRKIKLAIRQYFRNEEKNHSNILNIINAIPKLGKLLLNKNILNIIENIYDQSYMIYANYYLKTPIGDFKWHQNKIVGKSQIKENHVELESRLKNIFTIRVHLDEVDDKNGALMIVQGSHNKVLSSEEIQTITTNSIPRIIKVPEGGVHLIKPLLLHNTIKPTNQKKRRVIEINISMR